MNRLLAFVFAACALLVGARVGASSPPVQQHWLILSDIHFNPFADPRLVARLVAEPASRWRDTFEASADRAFSGYGADTNDALLESALEAMRGAVADPTIVIVDGDFLAHGFRAKFDRTFAAHDDAAYAAFTDKTISFLARELELAFPRARILPAIGNNDSACGDYASTPGSPFMSHVGAEFAIATGAGDPNAFVASFAKGGYYVAPLPAGSAHAVVLNDVFWSAKYRNRCGVAGSDPGATELAWLQQTLATLHGPVWLIAHMPPGVDVYATLHAPAQQPVTFLSEPYNQALSAMLGGQTPPIAFGIFGHTHMSSFAVGGASKPATPMLLVPSLSPIFGNNPSFTVLDVDAQTAAVENEQVYALQNLPVLVRDGRERARWNRVYAFDSVYGNGPLNARHLAAAQAAIFSSERVRRRFADVYNGGAAARAMPDDTWRAYWCAGIALDPVSYSACAKPTIQTALPTHPPPPPPPTPTPPPPSSAPSPSPSPSV